MRAAMPAILYASGSVNQKVAPSPGALSTPTVPPWRSKMVRQM